MSAIFPIYSWQDTLDLTQTCLFCWPEDLPFLQEQTHFLSLCPLLGSDQHLIDIGRNSYNAGVYSFPFSRNLVKEKTYLLTKIRSFIQQKILHTKPERCLFHWGKTETELSEQINQQVAISYLNLSYHPKNLGFKSDIATIEFAVITETVQHKQQIFNLYEECCNIVRGMITARKLSDLPSDIANPEYIATRLKSYAQQEKLKIRCLNAQSLQTEELNLLYAVGKSGFHSPYLIQVDYQGMPDQEECYCFVGKGITFDTGGLWLKTGDGMKTMKYDMCGAALLIGLLEAVVENKLPINLRIVIGVAENMINEKAMRPGEVVRAYSGKTIEIINTDAEGRLILADLLAFSAKQNPTAIIDVATLTGAVVKALGYDISGVMSNQKQLVEQFHIAAEQTQDAIWQLPCDERFMGQVESQIADYCNTPPNNVAICVSAGFFLSRFVEECPWIHLDISGTTLYRDQGTYASGKPLHLLYQFLKNRIQH